MGPSEEEAKLIGDWLEERDFKCPGCHRNDSFSLSGTISVLNVTGTIALDEPNLIELVTLGCKHCGYTSLFDPRVLKLPRE
jgi:hypothetical protein